MNGAGEKFFARAGFAVDQHRHLRVGQHGDALQAAALAAFGAVELVELGWQRQAAGRWCGVLVGRRRHRGKQMPAADQHGRFGARGAVNAEQALAEKRLKQAAG